MHVWLVCLPSFSRFRLWFEEDIPDWATNIFSRTQPVLALVHHRRLNQGGGPNTSETPRLASPLRCIYRMPVIDIASIAMTRASPGISSLTISRQKVKTDSQTILIRKPSLLSGSRRQSMNPDLNTFLLLDPAVPEQRAQWLDLWRLWPTQDVVAHPGYGELFARPGDRVVCACQMGVDSGILFPLIVRPLRTEPWGRGEGEIYDLVSPYGYGGPFGWGLYNVEAFWTGFEQWAQTIRAVSLFARFSLFKDQLIPFFGDTLVKGPCVIVSLEKPADILLRSYDKVVRENIRQAERAGVTLELDSECRRLDEFLSAYHSTMNRCKALSMYYFPKSFFERLIAQLSGRVALFHALHDQRIVSTELLLISKEYLYPFLGGTLEEGLQLRANPLLRHGIHLWGKAQGKQQVVLGGGHSGQDSLLRFKQRFATNKCVSFTVGAQILNSHLYRKLIDKRASWECEQGTQWSPADGFFPAYRG